MADDFQYINLPDGSRGKFAANASDETIMRAIQKDFPTAFAPKPLSGSISGAGAVPVPRDLQSDDQVMGTSAPKPISWLTGSQEPPQGSSSLAVAGHELKEGSKGAVKGLLSTVKNIHNSFTPNGPDGPDTSLAPSSSSYPGAATNLSADNPDQLAGKGLETFGEGLIPGGKAVAVADELLPSLARSGRAIESITQRALGQPVNVAGGESAAPLARLSKLAVNGGRMPTAAEQLLQRSQSAIPDLPFEDARDFYSNISRLSNDEYNSLTDPVKAQVGKLRAGLHQDLQAAAERAGNIGENLGQTYNDAVKEYRNRLLLNNYTTQAGKFFVKYALPTAGGLLGLDALEHKLLSH
jgi:hypothetical protein